MYFKFLLQNYLLQPIFLESHTFLNGIQVTDHLFLFQY